LKKCAAILILIFISILTLLSCVSAADSNSSQKNNFILNQSLSDSSNSTNYRENEILVRFTENSSNNSSIDEITGKIHEQAGSIVLKEFNEIKGLQLVKISEKMPLAEALGIYRQNKNVIYAEPNYIYKNQLIPNDAHYNFQWGLNRINATSAWNLTTGSSAVTIAIVDSGLDINHPDIKGNLWINTGEIAGNGIDDDGNGYIDDVYGWNFESNNNNITDEYGHGTHVAGIIAASGNNTIGVSGVMWNAKIMPLKFLDKDGNGHIADAVDAISYATKMGAFIINCSWGGSTYSRALKDIIELSSALVVCAAGNEVSGENTDISPNYPASYTSGNIISVAAIDKNDDICYFSNYGVNSVDVAAPGASIYSTLPGSGYGYMQGTSMATPYVSGLAGLVKSFRPDLNALQVKYTILNNVDTVTSLSGKILTGGVVNAFNSLKNIINDTSPPTVNADLKGGSYYYYPLKISLTTDKPGKIYYTLDGTSPTGSSTAYTDPIILNASKTLKFMAVDSSGTLSQIYTEIYLIYRSVTYSYPVQVPYQVWYKGGYSKPYTVRVRERHRIRFFSRGKWRVRWTTRWTHKTRYRRTYGWTYYWAYYQETRYGQKYELI
jgi:subtilisin family serine protease